MSDIVVAVGVGVVIGRGGQVVPRQFVASSYALYCSSLAIADTVHSPLCVNLHSCIKLHSVVQLILSYW